MAEEIIFRVSGGDQCIIFRDQGSTDPTEGLIPGPQNGSKNVRDMNANRKCYLVIDFMSVEITQDSP